MLHLGEAEGRYYGIPYTVDLSGLVWNKELFREAGLDPERPPETWDELIEYAQKLTKTNDSGEVEQYGFAIVGTSAVGRCLASCPLCGHLEEICLTPMVQRCSLTPESIEACRCGH